MQSIRNRGEGRAERRQRSAPHRHGLFSTTALIPAIAALAGGAMMAAPGYAQAQTVAASGAVANGFGDASLCVDPSLDLCPIDLGAKEDTAPVAVTSFATAKAGRSLMLGDGLTPQFSIIGNTITYSNGEDANQGITFGNPVNRLSIASGTATHSGILTETGGPRVLEKIGAGTIVLTNAGNSYSGGTIVSEGTLEITNAGALGAGAVTNNATLRLNSSSSFTFANTVSGTGALVKIGNSFLTLTGANSYAGGTTIGAGVLFVSSDGNLGDASGGLTFSGGSLAVTGNISTNRAVVASSTANISVGSGLTVSLGGLVSGNGGFSKTGPGTLELSGTNTYLGNTVIADGSLNISSDANLGASTSNVQMTGGTLGIRGILTTSRQFELQASSTIDVSGANTASISGLVSSSGGLTKTGTGTLTLSGANNYSGVTNVSAGTLAIANASALGATLSGTNVADGATLALQGGLTGLGESITLRGAGVSGNGALRNLSGDNAVSGAITLASEARINSDAGTLNLTGSISAINTNVLVGGAGNVTFSGSLSLGAGQIIKNGTGTLAFGSVLNLTGTTGGLILSQGTLSLGTSLTAGFGAITTTGSVIAYASGIDNGAPIVLDSNSTQLQVTTGSATQSGAISEINGPRPIEKIGGGTLTLATDNSYSGGTIISGGTLVVTADARLGAAAGGVTINDAALSISNTNPFTTDRAFTLTGNATIGVVNLLNSSTINGIVSGSGNLIKGSLGTLILTGNNNYSGTTTANGGTLQIGNGGTTGTLGAGAVTLNATNLIFNRSDSFTVANAIGSTGTLTKFGAGTLTATGALSYSTSTQILGGTLQIASTGSFSGGGSLTINGLDAGFVLNAASGSVSSVDHAVGSLTLNNAATLDVITGNYVLGVGTILGNGTIRLLNNNRTFNITNSIASISAGTTITNNGSAVSPNSVTVNVGALNNNYSLAPTITGSSMRLVLGNAGRTTTVSGNNSFGGGTSLDSGTLIVSSDTALGTGALTMAANTTLLSGGTGDRSLANAIVLNGAGLTIGNPNAGTNFTLSGALSGGNGFTKSGAGTLILTGANNYSGDTTISAGTLQVGSGALAGSLGTGNVSVSSGATLAFDSSASQSLAGVLSGAGSLVKSGTGTLTLNGANALFSGTTTINGGTISIGNASALGTGGLVFGGTGTLLATASASVGGINVLAGSSGTLAAATGQTLTIGGTYSVGANGILRIGTDTATGTVTLNTGAVGTFTAPTSLFVDAGTAQVSGATANSMIESFRNITVGTGTSSAVLDIGAQADSVALRNFSGNANGILTNNGSRSARAALASSVNTSFAGIVRDGSAVIGIDIFGLSGSSVTLSGANTYTGATIVSQGTLIAASNAALGSTASGTTVTNGATLQFSGTPLNIGEALTISGTGNGGIGAIRVVPAGVSGNESTVLTGGVTLAANSTITVADRIALTFNTGGISLGASTLTFASEGTGNSSTFVNSAISGTGGLIKTGSGLLRLNGNNGFTGPLTINGGDVALASGTALADTVGVSMVTGARLFVSSSETIGSLAGAGTVNFENGSVLTTGGNNTSTTFAGIIAGTGSLTKAGTGTFTLTGASNYTGTTTISGGALQIGEGGTTGSIATSSILNNAILIFNRSDSVSLGTAISGAGQLQKRGTGELTLTGANSFAGGFSVIEGTLTAAGATSLGSGTAASTIASGATLALANAGTVANAISVEGTGVGGAGALRATSGTQTLTGGITLSADTLFSVAAGATLNLQGSTLSGPLQRLTIDNAGAVNISKTISGLRSVTKNGTGTLTLSGTNSFQSLIINAGRVSTQMGSAIDDFAAVTVASGATLDNQSAQPELIGSLAGAGSVIVSDATGTLDVGSDNTSTLFSGQISGLGGLAKRGTGTFTLSGTNTYERITSIIGGTLVLQGGSALSDTAQFEVNTGATLRIEAGETTGAFSGNGSIVLATTGPFISNAQQNQSFGGVISESGVVGSFTKRGAGLQILTAAQSYTGQTSVEAGTLSLTGGGALASTPISTSAGATLTTDGGAFSTNTVISHAGVLTLTGPETVGSISGSGAINLSNSSARLTTGNASDATLSGIIGGSGGLTKTGTGSLTLSGANTYAGGTIVNAGTLVLNQVAGGIIDALGTEGLTLGSDTTLLSNVTGRVSNAITSTSATNVTFGAATGAVLTLAGSSFRIFNPIALTFGSATSTGRIDLAAPSPVSIVAGTRAIIAGGTVRTSTNFGANILDNASGGTTIGTGATAATLDTNGLSFQLVNLGGTAAGTLTNLGSQASTLTLNNQSASTFAGTITNGTSAINLIKSGTLSLSLTGTNSYTGTTGVSSGTLAIGDGGTTGTLGTGTVSIAAAGTLAFNRSNAMTVANTINGAGALQQQGTGTTSLTGDLSGFSGAVTVTAGTLQIGNGGTTGSIGTGAVTNNATLAINLSSDITLAQTITGTGALRKLDSGVATLGGNLTLGSATVEAGTLALSGTNSFTGGITVAGGTLSLRSNTAAGGATGVIRTTGSVIDYADGIDMATPITLSSNTTQLQVLTGSATQSGVISEQDGARPLEKIGAGTLTLSGTNSYSGGTTISAGRLNVAADANLGAAAGGITLGNATLGTTATFNSARSVTLTGAGGFDVASGTALTLTGAVSGTGNLTKTGLGQLFLAANSNYTGPTTVSSGVLVVGTGGTTGTIGTGNLVNNSTVRFNRSNDFTVANTISGGGNLVKEGNGTLTLTGANSFAGGVFISAGNLVLASATGGVINAAGTGTISTAGNTTL